VEVKINKKFFVSLLVLFVLGSILYSAGRINVISPASGSSWEWETELPIKWQMTVRKPICSYVNIYLYNKSGMVLEIKKQVYNSENYKWLIPSNLEPGTYYIKIKGTYTAVFGNSGYFTIKEPAPAIGVQSPFKDQKLYKGVDVLDIAWMRLFSMDRYVNIFLFKPDKKTLQTVIARRVPNRGNYRWNIPSTIPEGQYVIQVITTDGRVSDFSEVFNILDIPPTLKLESPENGFKWYQGLTYDIGWFTMSLSKLDPYIELALYRADNKAFQTFITRRYPTSRKDYKWKISTTIPPGKYFIRIRTKDGKFSDDSGVFTIAKVSLFNMKKVKIKKTIINKTKFD